MTMPDTVPAVELRGVSMHYGIGKDQRVAGASDVSLVIEAGTLVALSGASGSGKSTLLHLIGAMERPDSGTILSGATEVTALRGGSLAAYRRTVASCSSVTTCCPRSPRWTT
jgi:putative ABC transport system ATP-binding protein